MLVETNPVQNICKLPPSDTGGPKVNPVATEAFVGFDPQTKF